MKEDEKSFLIDVFRRCHGDFMPRDLINEDGFPMHPKRAWYLLEKWAGKGWYDYGVTCDLGWLRDKGKQIAEGLSNDRQNRKTS